MKKILSLIIWVTIVISCMNISFAQSNLPDDEMSTNVLLDYLEALKNEDIDGILENSINKEFPTLDDYQQDLVEYYSLENRKIISSYSIIDQTEESDGYVYTIRFYHAIIHTFIPKMVGNFKQRLEDMDVCLNKTTCEVREFDNDLVRRLLQSVKVINDELI